ncbi:MAG: sigma-70 family RNA polymerase sigma factor [Clostridia bacterium]|nr:sigma-70 family RNA polymerase sigma factor [Clostridia bacterium]
MEEILQDIIKAKAGDSRSFEALVKKFDPMIRSMAKKYSNMCNMPSQMFDDFLQEGKVAFYNAVNTYREDSDITFGAYSKVCVRNRLVSCVRSANSKKRLRRSDSKDNYDLDNPQDNLIARELEKKLFSLAQDCLSPYEKKIFTHYMNGERAKEISLKVNRSERSVNNAIYRIKAKLKRTTNSGT